MNRRKFVAQGSALLSVLHVGCTANEPLSVEVGVAGNNDSKNSQDVEPEEPDTAALQPPSECTTTLQDMEGPYYLEDIPVRDNLDLYGEDGQKITVHGYVCGPDCQPIPYAVVEVWHADTAGKYDTQSEEKRYYGQIAADESGYFRFTTILPGAYSDDQTDFRPRHFHVKVWVDGVHKLTTQLYFSNDAYLSYEPDTPSALMLDVDDSPEVLTRFDFTLLD